MKDVLLALAWRMYYECQACGHKQYFNHPDKPGYEIRVKAKKQTFAIFLNNHLISGSHYAYQLNDQLAKFNIQ
jgi:hypothetical protein